MPLPISDIPNNPYLKQLVAHSAMIHEHIEAYAEDGIAPHPLVMNQWVEGNDHRCRVSVDLLKNVYGVNLPESVLTEIVDDVTLGLSLEQAVVEIQILQEQNHEDKTSPNRERDCDDGHHDGGGKPEG